MRIALVFDTLFPVTKGGAERWFTALAGELAASGHDVTYVTSHRAGPSHDHPFSVVEVSRGGELYDAEGNRRLLPSIQFAVGVGRYLRRNRRRFDAVYVHQTPLLSVVAARLALGRSVPWAVEWIEWWSKDYWHRYSPGVVGRVGWLVQRLALACTPVATVFARSTEDKLRRSRPDLRVASMPGQLIDVEPRPATHPGTGVPLILFVGRLVPEKHPGAVLDAVEVLATRRPVRARIVGQGPLLESLRGRALASTAAVEVTGPIDQVDLESAYSEAAVLLHPSEREGFGLVVAEAAARGVPVVVVGGPDNAAVELVEDDVNGRLSPTRDARTLARAVEAVLDQGDTLRRATKRWFTEQAPRRSVVQTAESLVRIFDTDARTRTARPGGPR